jgi:phosphoribosyl 1,2-cyclic phosphate phosphodiesterase
MMQITFLGTGTSGGVPVLTCQCPVCQSLDFRDKRLRTSLLIRYQGHQIVIDTGPDFRQQALSARLNRLDAVVFTHEHKDHTAGLDDVRPFNYFFGNQNMPIYARKQVIEQLKREYAYAFADEKYPGIPLLEPIEITATPFEIGPISMIPIEVMHHKLPVYGFRIQDFTYITDANFISQESLDKIKGTKILVLNALQIQPHISHFTLQEAIDIAQKIGAEQTYFTHISHKLGSHADIQKILPDSVFLAYDGLSLTV